MIDLPIPEGLTAEQIEIWASDQIITNPLVVQMPLLERVAWVHNVIKSYNRADLEMRLREGTGKKCLFMPSYGEFGWNILFAARMVHFTQSSYKIVCCRRGFECLYPTANEFYYDWINPIPDEERQGTCRDKTHRFPEIMAKFPDATPISVMGLSFAQERLPFCPGTGLKIEPRIKRGLKADICIGTRFRKMGEQKNYVGWEQVASYLTSKGLTFAIIGSNESSYDLEGSICMSGDYCDLDAAVELLQNCKLFIGTDSGAAHLAALVNHSPIIIQKVPTVNMTTTTDVFIDKMRQMTDHEVIPLDLGSWNQPRAFIEQIKKFAR
jgi:hypothetical protein